MVDNKLSLGIELGSTRIKGVLIDDNAKAVFSGVYAWESSQINGCWTYSLEDAIKGVQQVYSQIDKSYFEKNNNHIHELASIGISAMMHGYIPLDENYKQLDIFKTWKNSFCEIEAKELSELFHFNVPQRWSVTHLYQAFLKKEPYINDIRYMNTLAGYIHYVLTNEHVLGIGDASGMFPIDIQTNMYDKKMSDLFYNKTNIDIKSIFPKVLCAGEIAGYLTEDGAKILDVNGNLRPNIPFCAPEGDMQTGMVATNSIAINTGNISAGTSINAMVITKNKLKNYYPEIDVVLTPNGNCAALVHCASCSSDINEWVYLFNDVLKTFDVNVSTNDLFEKLFIKAENEKPGKEEYLSYNFVAGEPILGLEDGCPIFSRGANSKLSIGTFMASLIYSAFSGIKIGIDALCNRENITIDKFIGHGGIFKTEGIAQQILANALNVPIYVTETSGEGGAYGIALLASYIISKSEFHDLEEYLTEFVYKNVDTSVRLPQISGVEDFLLFINRYKRCLDAEKEIYSNIRP